MIELSIAVMIGLFGGIAVGTQAPIAGAMAARVGGAASSFIVHLGGTLTSLVLLIVRRDTAVQEWLRLPWYMLGCGALGIVFYLSIAHTMPRIGATAAIALIVVGQLLAGLVIDQFGLIGMAVRPVDASRITAVVMLISGAYLVVR